VCHILGILFAALFKSGIFNLVSVWLPKSIANPPLVNPPLANPPLVNPPLVNPPLVNPPLVKPQTGGQSKNAFRSLLENLKCSRRQRSLIIPLPSPVFEFPPRHWF